MKQIIFHIDVNSAFLSWTAVEQLKNGADFDIREIPAMIGGDRQSRHGIVLAKSVSAKKFGIVTGEPVAHALQKCPNIQMFPPNHRMYHEYSERLMDFLRSYTPDIEQASVDECYMDFTGIAHKYHSPVEAAFEIKDAVYEKFGFTVNIGISVNRLLAKMASDFEKPNKVHTLFPEEIPVKMWPLPVSELYMAGRSSVEVLHKLEIRTIGELAKTDPSLLELHLKSHGRTLWEFANGMGSSKVIREHVENKGIGNSTTLSKDVTTEDGAKEVLLKLAEMVGGRLRKEQQKANMVSVEIKYSTFQSVSHQKQIGRATNADQMIYQTACELFRELWNGEAIRLLGIRTSKLVSDDEPEQMSIFDFEYEEAGHKMKDEKHQKLDKALDEIRKKFGNEAIKRGTFLK
ncbi:MAG: DNA polymerase IV [Tyzzerella sp.]|nr:DNA polymerase IV [Tyzzerella sp.]